MKKQVQFIIIGILTLLFFQCSENSIEEKIKREIILGNFSTAREMILDLILSKKDSISQHYMDSVNFEIERLDRIEQEFSLDSNAVLKEIREYVPGANRSDLIQWANSNYLESKIIEGERRYFKFAAENLFRVHPELKIIKEKADSLIREKAKIRKYEPFPLKFHVNRVIKEYNKTKQKHILPVTINIIHTITLDSNAIEMEEPDSGEVAEEPVKCWIPFPMEITGQQYNVRRMTSDPHIHLIAGENHRQRTIYLQQLAQKGQFATFMVEYEFTTSAVYNNIQPEKVTPLSDTSDLSEYLKERPPHIVFDPALRELSHLIVGDETNPYFIAKKIFTWIDENLAWVKMREYSTVRSLCLYPFFYKQGDAGVKTFLFMTLCRYNNIPTRLVSGVQFQPPLKSLHDWCDIYLESYGWVPVDVTYGQMDFPDDKRRYFYLGNIDSYRLIFNQDYSCPFVPPKEFFRSDIIDNQRGELETMEENLYFDKWDWDMKFKIISSYK